MDSKQFINSMSRRLNLEEATTLKLLEGFAAVVGEECRDQNRVALPALGSFRGVKRDETIVRDLTTGVRLLLPPSIEMEFTPGGRLINGVAEGSARK